VAIFIFGKQGIKYRSFVLVFLLDEESWHRLASPKLVSLPNIITAHASPSQLPSS